MKTWGFSGSLSRSSSGAESSPGQLRGSPESLSRSLQAGLGAESSPGQLQQLWSLGA